MRGLAEVYYIVHQQGFIPIFVDDDFDAVRLAEASIQAGAAAVEITCRRSDVCDDIRRVRKAFPDLIILAGSTVDDGPMLDFLRRRRPRFPNINDLCEIGVEGFVSAMPLSLDRIAQLSKTHLLVPGVETVTEAVAVVEAGAHFAKFFNTGGLGEHRRVALVTSTALHGLLPIFVTGGITLDKIDAYVQSRVALLGSGWDVLAGDRYRSMQENADVARLASLLGPYLDAMRQARARHQPMPTGGDTDAYLRAVPHYHPFDDSFGS